MKAEADVHRGDSLGGRITRTKHGSVFEYDASFDADLAFGLPRAQGRFEKALDVCSAPFVERLKLLRVIVFSYLIGNGDLHGKNVSVRVIDGRVELTPAYDLFSTLPYGDEHMAMKLDGRDARLSRSTFMAAAERFDLPRRAVEAAIDELLERIAPTHDALGEIGLDAKKTRALDRSLRRRAADLS